MDNINYSHATNKDLDLLVQSRIEFLCEYWGDKTNEEKANLGKELYTYFKKALGAGTYICWIARSGEDFAGIGGMAITERPGGFRVPVGKCGYIMNMYTRENYRRKGIGTGILKQLMQSAKEQGVTYLELHATEEGEPLYIKENFLKHSEPTYRMFL